MAYEPDEQDELMTDAMAVGGPAFVEELHYAAMDAAEAACLEGGSAVLHHVPGAGDRASPNVEESRRVSLLRG